MNFSSVFGSVASIFSAVVTFVGVVLAIAKWRESNKLKRAEFLREILEKLRGDEKISDIMYKIEYGERWYNADFHGSPFEKNMDAFISFVNYISYLKKQSIIEKNEFQILAYELQRICQNPDMQHYLWNLYHFSQETGKPCTFQELIDYAMTEKIFDPDFLTNKNKFEKMLNF